MLKFNLLRKFQVEGTLTVTTPAMSTIHNLNAEFTSEFHNTASALQLIIKTKDKIHIYAFFNVKATNRKVVRDYLNDILGCWEQNKTMEISIPDNYTFRVSTGNK